MTMGLRILSPAQKAMVSERVDLVRKSKADRDAYRKLVAAGEAPPTCADDLPEPPDPILITSPWINGDRYGSRHLDRR